jgi:hypothetical protein
MSRPSPCHSPTISVVDLDIVEVRDTVAKTGGLECALGPAMEVASNPAVPAARRPRHGRHHARPAYRPAVRRDTPTSCRPVPGVRSPTSPWCCLGFVDPRRAVRARDGSAVEYASGARRSVA